MANTQKLEINCSLKIQKPAREVFEAIVDPSKMSKYFISKSTGRMETGITLTWQFPEFDMQFPVRVLKVDPDKYISYSWDNPEDETSTTVEITLTPVSGNDTLVTIMEKARDNDDRGIKWLKGNTQGWANFLACLKAYLEYGINLRRGAFDPSQMPTKEAVA